MIGTTRSTAVVAPLAVGLVLAVAGSTASAAHVGDDPLDCDAEVVDTSGELDTVSVADAADAVETATVIVRGYRSVPDGDLIGTVDELIAACFDGVEDLALLAFSVEDRQSDVFLGQELPGLATPEAIRDTMSAPFPDGEFTEGVIAAIDRVADETATSVAAGEPPADVGAVDGDGGGGVDEGDGEGGEEGGGGVPIVPLVAAGVVVTGAGGAWAVRRRRKLAEERARFEQAARDPRIRVGAVREQGVRLESQAELWAKTSVGRTATALAEKRQQVRAAGNATESAAALVGQATPNGVDRASFQQLRQATGRLDELLAALDANEAAIGELLAFGAYLDRVRVALPAKKELLLGELAAAEELANQRRTDGWKVDQPVAELARVRSMLGAVEVYELALDLLSLSDRTEAAEAAAFAARHDLQSLPDRPGSIQAWRGRQVEAAQAENERTRAVEERLGVEAGDHSPESWQWAAGHPDRAREHLRQAVAIGDRTDQLVADQAFDEAGQVLEQAGLQLIAADELLDELDDLLIDLQQAKLEAAGIVAESRQVLGQFVAFVRDHASDLDGAVRARPDELDAALDGLALELSSPRPNYLRVAETGEQLNRELDDALATAEEQHRRMEALRRQAAREVARAQRNLQRARQSLGWELFESDDARSISRLDRRLSRLPTAPEARRDEARFIADQAVVVQDRIIARRRRSGNWVVVGGAGWGRGGGGWGGSGSSGGGGGISLGGGGGGGFSLGGGGGGGRSFGGGRSSGSW